ncbi:ABC transporter substrate-binding protein [Noviherbaspirillum sp. CPCC 100848]|uniref:Probable sugar-binding periplasmic protein n=1 Tax=Noviherbaspirillum album TaxID=3080276 RepID=A0ABU6JFB9_9BURK|nr:ABC transporter substrate-binding protein [Noviherbaspirillum sp. CPCC 100848]MEC4722103.1 ABC transporter substrate-binding protein [Noviherbaspirillum sp. CPCC 100848]
MKRRSIVLSLLAAITAASAPSVWSAPVVLTIESWRNDDLPMWRDKIIPAFEKNNPDIKIKFAPTAPAEYNAVLNSKLEAGTAGDLITCRPFDVPLQHFQKGRLLPLNDLKGMDNFAPVAKTAWTTDDGKTTFCVPIAAVMHGFMYNKEAFTKLGITPPATVEQFFAALQKIKADGKYVPLAMGTKDTWEASQLAYQNIAPNYYKGEEGRQALIAGKAKLTNAQYLEPFRTIAKWKPYLGDGFESQTYPDSQNMFTLGRAAIYPAGSWEIAGFNKQAGFKIGAFPPPVQKAGDKCYISDHPDIALGINAKSKNAAAAKVFLEFVASKEFAKIYANSVPGFFSLQKTPVEMTDPLANEFASWRGKCESTPRLTHQILSRGTPNLEDELWIKAAAVMNGTLTPEAAAQQLQKGLDSWYKPAN